MGYSRPNSDATFFSASSIFLRFSAVEKSTNGSFVNSLNPNFASAVAMAKSSSSHNNLIIIRPLQPEQPCPSNGCHECAHDAFNEVWDGNSAKISCHSFHFATKNK